MKTRNHAFDILKILSAFAVIIIHVSAIFLRESGHDLEPVAMALNTIARFAVPVFVMISGALFIKTKADLPLKVILKKYVLRLTLIYVGTLALYFILYSIFPIREGWFGGLSHVVESTKSLAYQLWFIPMLAGLYILTPFLKHFKERKHFMPVLVFVVIVSIFFFCQQTISLFFQLGDFKILYPVRDLISVAQSFLPAISLWVGLYLMGYYLTEYSLALRHRRFIYICSAALLVINISLSFIFSLKGLRVDTVDVIHDPLNIVSILLSFSLILLAMHNRYIPKLSQRAKSIIVTLSGFTLGVFLIHILFMDLLFRQTLPWFLEQPTGIWTILISIGLFIISLCATFIYYAVINLAKKILKPNRTT
ncbi:acyltransferase family protein [Candidatus Saccharibacteria bacterium]|nr:acyltransferase family protein [Candidatus Saccharibacteria bacterium]